jgi:putative transcriptional regulator
MSRADTINKMWRIQVLMAICAALGVALAGESVAGGSLDQISIATTLTGTRTGEPDRGMFLVARRTLDGPHFGQSVVYLVEHGEDGTLGLIVNRSIDISLSEAVPGIEDKQATAHALYYGGPVGLPMILMLMRSESATEGMEHVANGVYISSDQRVLDEILAAKKPASEVRFYIGHSGWAAGQLDFELERGSWHVVAADTDAIFSSKTDSLWDRLIERLEPRGIQVDNRPSLPILAFATNPCCQCRCADTFLHRPHPD